MKYKILSALLAVFTLLNLATPVDAAATFKKVKYDGKEEIRIQAVITIGLQA